MRFIILKNKKSQVWVETAIYTLIGLTIIAIVLSIVAPQIERAKEKTIIAQTYEALNELNTQIRKVSQVAGNKKIVSLRLTKGSLTIDGTEGEGVEIGNKITYTLEDTKLEFSEVDTEIKEGDIYIMTEKYGRNYNIFLETRYDEIFDITFSGEDKSRVFYGGGAPYEIIIENIGYGGVDGRTKIDIIVS
ncbi:MAG: hypothetical protein ABIH37_01850 [archaeon]